MLLYFIGIEKQLGEDKINYVLDKAVVVLSEEVGSLVRSQDQIDLLVKNCALMHYELEPKNRELLADSSKYVFAEFISPIDYIDSDQHFVIRIE